MTENVALKINIDPAKPSHTWKFRMKTKDSYLLKELIEKSGYPDCATFFRNLLDERLIVETAFDDLAEKWWSNGETLLGNPIGFRAVQRSAAKRDVVVRRKGLDV